MCDLGKERIEHHIMQLIIVPESNLKMYFMIRKLRDDPNAEEHFKE